MTTWRVHNQLASESLEYSLSCALYCLLYKFACLFGMCNSIHPNTGHRYKQYPKLSTCRFDPRRKRTIKHLTLNTYLLERKYLTRIFKHPTPLSLPRVSLFFGNWIGTSLHIFFVNSCAQEPHTYQSASRGCN